MATKTYAYSTAQLQSGLINPLYRGLSAISLVAALAALAHWARNHDPVQLAFGIFFLLLTPLGFLPTYLARKNPPHRQRLSWMQTASPRRYATSGCRSPIAISFR